MENILLLFTVISKTLICTLPRSWITQGFIPIAGYNYGAENYERVKESIQISIKYAALATFVFCHYTLLRYPYHCHFTSNEKIIAETQALRWYLPLLL
jgi:Na+-driven multidrug efflux pump